MKFYYSIITLIFVFIALLCGCNFTPKESVDSGQNKEYPINLTTAAKYFDEYKNICDKDDGVLWGKRLYGPFMIVDPKTRFIVANCQNKEKSFKKSGNVYVGYLPKNVNVSDTSLYVFGENWTMMNWKHIDKKNQKQRDWIFMHENFHRLENNGFLNTVMTGSNSHLDELDGRIYLILEWRALTKALLTTGNEQKRAIEDALIFRNYRRTLFPDNIEDERTWEMQEGLADYTGCKLSGYTSKEMKDVIAERMENAEKQKPYNWTFFFENGPAYGLLLDDVSKNWRKQLSTKSDLGKVLQTKIHYNLPKDLMAAVKKRMKYYDGTKLADVEKKYQEKIDSLSASYIQKFIKNNTLKINLIKMNMSIKPHEAFPLGNYGKVFKTGRVVDEWGILTVSKGFLLSKNWKTIWLTTPEKVTDKNVKGNGWNIELKTGWEIIKNKDGSWSLDVLGGNL